VISLGKNIENNLLNPKRLMITLGIILIFLFGLALDFTCPLTVKATDIDTQIAQAKVQVEYLSGLIDEYYEIHGEYPPFVCGGDAEGYQISGMAFYDPLISSETTDSYPIVKRNSIVKKRTGDAEEYIIAHLANYDSLIASGITNSYPLIKRNSISEKRAFVTFISKSKVKKWFLGKNGNRMANISNVLRDDFAYENFRNSNINPLAGMFHYTSVVLFNSPGYDLFIMGNTFDESFNLHDKTKWFQSPYYDDYGNNIPREPNGFIYGISVRHVDGIQKITEYEYGVQ
jgi:hypothetical protein